MTHTAEKEARTLRLNLYGPIGKSPLVGSDGITSAWVAEQIVGAGEVDQIAVYINSPGGDVFEGIAIYNELKQFPGQVNVYIMGVAASIASIIAMAGDQRVIYDGAEFMIHQASGMTFGTADHHVKQAKLLRRLDKKLANIYADTTGGDAVTIAEMMAEETWMESDDALADGFATHGSPQEAVAPPSACMSILNQYQNVPLKVALWADPKGGETTQPTTELLAMDELKKPDEELKHDAMDDPAEEEKPEASEEETVEELKAKIAELEAKLAEGESEEIEEEEQPAEAQAIAKAFAHDKAFAVDMIGQGKSLDDSYRAYAAHAKAALSDLANKVDAANDGVNPVAIASRPAVDDTDADLVKVYARARDMKSDMGRNAFLNDQGIDPTVYAAWLKSNG